MEEKYITLRRPYIKLNKGRMMMIPTFYKEVNTKHVTGINKFPSDTIPSSCSQRNKG